MKIRTFRLMVKSLDRQKKMLWFELYLFVYNLFDSWRSIRSLGNSISELKLERPGNQSSSEEVNYDEMQTNKTGGGNNGKRKKVFMVIGINTAFSSRRRRDSIRETWMPRGTFVDTCFYIYISLFLSLSFLKMIEIESVLFD